MLADDLTLPLLLHLPPASQLTFHAAVGAPVDAAAAATATVTARLIILYWVRDGGRRTPVSNVFALCLSVSCFGLSRFVSDFNVSGKIAEPKMAFNFAHLLSAACGGAPRRLGRLRRLWARCAHLFWGGCEHRKIALFLS